MDPAPKPIRSLHEDDPEIEDALDSFILGLGEVVDGLQDAILAQDWPKLTAGARAFCDMAQELGYPALVEVLTDVLSAANRPDEEGARKAVGDLTELAQRVRRGHHSSA